MNKHVWTLCLMLSEVALVAVHGARTYSIYEPGDPRFHALTGSVFGALLYLAPNPIYLIVPVLKMENILPRFDPIQAELFGSFLFLFVATPVTWLIGGVLTRLHEAVSGFVALFAYIVISAITYVCVIGLVMYLQS